MYSIIASNSAKTAAQGRVIATFTRASAAIVAFAKMTAGSESLHFVANGAIRYTKKAATGVYLIKLGANCRVISALYSDSACAVPAGYIAMSRDDASLYLCDEMLDGVSVSII